MAQAAPRRRAGPAALAACACFGALIAYGALRTRAAGQEQDDPAVARVWLVAATFGPNATATAGTPIQGWLNSAGITALGTATELRSAYHGDPACAEVWFGYDSHLPGAPPLVCHRVEATAFADDRGQAYHGYLDYAGRYVGVYLPGYDHAARTLTCQVRWMPRSMAGTSPVSRPMTFTVPLPALRRVLPAAGYLDMDEQSQSRGGVTVSAGDARLGPVDASLTHVSQRFLYFRLRVRGGWIADSNVIPPAEPGAPMPVPRPRLALTDPFGVELLSQVPVSPAVQPLHPGDDTAWMAPVNGAGSGTDAVRLTVHVMPEGGGALRTFEFILPVQQREEV